MELIHSVSGAHGFITNHLQHKQRYLEHRRLTPQQKKEYFPHSTGYRDAVTIAEAGHEKLNSVNQRVEDLFREATADVPSILLRGALSAFNRISKVLITRLTKLAPGHTAR